MGTPITLDAFALKDVFKISAFSTVGNYLRWVLMDNNTVTLTNSGNTVWATGTDDAKLAGFDTDAACVLAGESGLISLGLVSSQTGSDIEQIATTTDIVVREVIKVDNAGKFFTEYTGKGTVGNEIKYIYVKENKFEIGERYSQDATAGTTAFAYDPSTKEITVPTGITPTEVVIYYTPEITDVLRITNSIDNGSETVDLVVDGLVREICSQKDYKAQIRLRAKVDPNFALATGKEAGKHPFAFESILGCEDSNLWVLDVYDVVNIVA